MNRKFANPYIVFYPIVSRDGMPFPFNKAIREIQGRAFREEFAWRGDIIVAKYRDSPFSSMMDASMADFPLLKNYLLTHGAPMLVSRRRLYIDKTINICYLVNGSDTDLDIKIAFSLSQFYPFIS
jgi:hypothetical protein